MDPALHDALVNLAPDDDDEQGDVTDLLLPEHYHIKSGVYKGLVLPRMVPAKAKNYAKILAMKAAIVADPDFQRMASTLAYTYARMRRESERKARELAEHDLQMEAVKLLMIDQMDAEGETGLSLSNGDKVRWQPEPHLVVLDKEEFRVWCLKEGFDREMVLPWPKANRHMKDMLKAGEREPPGTEAYMKPKVIFTKGEK